MSVFDLKRGESGIVKSCNLNGSAAARLNSLGITAGKKITLLSFSLFRGSALIGCGAVRVGMRASLAKLIEVEKCV